MLFLTIPLKGEWEECHWFSLNLLLNGAQNVAHVKALLVSSYFTSQIKFKTKSYGINQVPPSVFSNNRSGSNTYNCNEGEFGVYLPSSPHMLQDEKHRTSEEKDKLYTNEPPNTSSCQLIYQSWGRFLKKSVFPSKSRGRLQDIILQQGQIWWLYILKFRKEKGRQANIYKIISKGKRFQE